MALHKVDGHNVLMSGTKVNAAQMKLVTEMIKANGGPIIQRKDLKALHTKLRGAKASPYFIAKNVSAKKKEKGEAVHGMYDLSVFSLSAEAAKAEKAGPATTKTPKAKKEAKPKAEKAPKVAKARKGKKTADAPVADEVVEGSELE